MATETAATGEAEAARYEYAFLRAVPRADRDESVNVGVVLYCRDRRFLAALTCADLRRVGLLDPSTDLAGLARQLAVVSQACARAAELPWDAKAGEQGRAFAWLTAPRSTVLRSGPVHGGFTPDPAREIARLVRSVC